MRSVSADLGSEADLCGEGITWWCQLLTYSAWRCSLVRHGDVLQNSWTGLIGDITSEGSSQPLAQ